MKNAVIQQHTLYCFTTQCLNSHHKMLNSTQRSMLMTDHLSAPILKQPHVGSGYILPPVFEPAYVE